jgi:hypothetical protein
VVIAVCMLMAKKAGQVEAEDGNEGAALVGKGGGHLVVVANRRSGYTVQAQRQQRQHRQHQQRHRTRERHSLLPAPCGCGLWSLFCVYVPIKSDLSL